MRPRQARYQAALRPDMKYALILLYLPVSFLLTITTVTRYPLTIPFAHSANRAARRIHTIFLLT